MSDTKAAAEKTAAAAAAAKAAADTKAAAASLPGAIPSYTSLYTYTPSTYSTSMSSAITKPQSIQPQSIQQQSIEPKTTIAPNYNKLLSIPAISQQPTETKTDETQDGNQSSSSDSKLWLIRLLIIVGMLTVIIVTLSYVSSTSTNSYITSTTTADISNT